jgi:CBS domain-containing protein
VKLADHEQMPPVAALMTPFPYFVRPDDPARRAADLMREHAIRHVPVKEGDRVSGIVSERDLRSAGADAAVRDVQGTDVYTVEMNASLALALREMARRKIGTAVVLRAGKLAGIVTVTDVCRAFAEVLEGRFEPPEGGSVA